MPPLIDTAHRSDLDGLVALMRANGLPTAGLVDPLEPALVARDGGAVVASAMVERYGRTGLLRSVAVASDWRGTGLGQAMVARAIELAEALEVETIVLLTETAAPFFARFGFHPLTRSRVPQAVRQSLEFASVCPATAQAMARPVRAPRRDDEGGAIVRAALGGDAPAITAIYNQGIEDRLGTFETRPRTERDVLAWFDGTHPVVVVEDADGRVVAFAATGPYRARECYAGVAEFSVYVARSARGRGLGRLAISGLVEAATDAGFWKLISRVFVENDASRRLLAACGFREVGTYEKHGRLDGRWRDVVIVERVLEANLA